MTSTDFTAVSRMEATLAAMGAAGYCRKFDHAQMAYDPYRSILYIAFDYYAWDESADQPADLTLTWRAICQLVRAAGRDAGDLEIPGDRELNDALADGTLADVAAPFSIRIPRTAVLGREWTETGITSWVLEVPGAPWIPGQEDARMTPTSPEVAAHALAMARG
jgi:hypothetical protein